MGRLLMSMTAVSGAAVAVLVAADGSTSWRVVRALVVVAVTLGAVVGERRVGVAVRVAGAAVFGVAGAVAGVGIGLRHIQKSGASGTGVVGLVALAAGLVLLAYAIAACVRAARGWLKVLVAPAVVVMLVLVWSLSVAVMATNVPSTSLGSATPADRGLAYTDATFRTADGVTLSAWYVASTNRAAVVVLHGAGSTRSSTLEQATVLARHGYGVLMVDARGHGRSGGRGMDFGWYGDHDTAAAVTYLQHRADVDPARIGVLGLSMGGEEAIGAAASDPRIRAVVAEGATARTAQDKAGWLPGGVNGALQRGIDRVTFRAADLLTAAHPPISLHDAIAATAPRPVLLIAAGQAVDEARAGRYLQSASPATARLWVVPGSTHTAGLATEPQQWEERVVGFFDGALRPRAPTISR